MPEDLTMVELYILESINHYSEELVNYLQRKKLPEFEQRFANEYMDYIHTYRDVLSFIRKLREKQNNDNTTSQNHSEETSGL